MRLFILILAVVCHTNAFPNVDKSTQYESTIGQLKSDPWRAMEEDANLTVPQLITKYGYPFEEYFVITHDGYILNLHRIPYGRDGPSENRQPVFVMHGILCSSADWVIAGPGLGLAYILADKGYDVWLGNARGSSYSRNHTYLSPDNDPDRETFWHFSWNEIGYYDLPTMIDFVLETTQFPDVFYIGHSQGTTSFFVMTSTRPEYNSKIKAQFSLAPIAFMDHMTSPVLKFIANFDGAIGSLLEMIGIYEFLPTDGFVSQMAQGLCNEGDPTQILCTNILFVLCGFNKDKMNTTLLPIIMGHTPAGASSMQMLHYAQEINSGYFRKYDFGLVENMEIYGENYPPNYPLEQITAPVYLFYSHNDWLAAETDVLRLYDKLPNVLGKFLVADDKWNHLDYLWGIDVDVLVYNKVLSLMERH